MRHREDTPNEDVARLHERAALFFELLDHRDRAAAERERARRVRMALDEGPDGDGSPVDVRPRAEAA